MLKIAVKLQCVLIPKFRKENSQALRDWDLWGPLLLCMFLGVCLCLKAGSDNDKNDVSVIFVISFSLIWVGSIIITINGLLLGANFSFFQSVCILGYSVLPVDIAALVNALVKWPSIIKLCIAGAGSGWAIFSSFGFITELVIPDKKILAMYPVVLFYLFLGWFVLIVWLQNFFNLT